MVEIPEEIIDDFRSYIYNNCRSAEKDLDGRITWAEYPFIFGVLRSLRVVQFLSLSGNWKVVDAEESKRFRDFYSMRELYKLADKL